MDDAEEDRQNELFLAKYSELIDDLVGTDVNTKETFDFLEMAEDAEPFSAMDIERISGDLFATRIRYSLALIALRVIGCLTKPRDTWKKSMRDVRNARARVEIMYQLMETLDEQIGEEDEQ